MELIDLLQNTGIKCPEMFENIEITGINYDSRKVKEGNIFVCLRGTNTDGHIYAADAAFRGALAIVSEKELSLPKIPIFLVKDSRKALSKIAKNYFGNPGEGISLYGITGTNGKTTVSYLIKSGIEAQGRACGLMGTISYKIGRNEYEAERTTPESLDLYRMFSQLKKQEIDCCVMEVSSHALKLGRVQDIEFDYSLFTNMSLDHLDFHGDEEEYFKTKKKLFEQTKKMGIINKDDAKGKRLIEELKSMGLAFRSFSLDDDGADYIGHVVEMTGDGCRLNFNYKGSLLVELKSSLTGQFSLYNILAAASCLHAAGVEAEAIARGIKGVKLVPGRFERVENSRNIPVFVDFAHTPHALENILVTASNLTRGRIICVFGCGGNRDKSKRPLMGQIAGQYADYCIITGDNPRNEDQEQIFEDIEEGLYDSGCFYEIIRDRREAIKQAIKYYREGDIIIVAGKGHENYQIIGGTKNYFSDREVVKELIDKGDSVTNEEI